MNGRSNSNSGFTLLEVMVSVTILVMMALMLSRIFSESSRAVILGNDRSMLDETARLVLDVAAQDISQALIRTNAAFRVHSEDDGDALYFVSTAVRRQLAKMPRDTAPMRLQSLSSDASGWSRFVSIEAPCGSSGDTAGGNAKMIQLSDYYFTDPAQTAADFKSVHGKVDLSTSEEEYTQSFSGGTGGLDSHAVLTFMDITVNADPSWNYANTSGQPDPANPPRFIDIAIGLIASTDMEQALRLRSTQGEARGLEFIEQHEQIYSRRIFMRNQGADRLAFP